MTSAIRRLGTVTKQILVSLCMWGGLSVADVAAQTAPAPQEVQVGASAFTKGSQAPSWVQPVDIPPTTKTQPVVLRLADTQIQVEPTPAHYVHRAIQVNDSGALGQIGQYAIDFVPQYQQVALHRLEILRGDQTLNMLERATVRFLQRESGLENGIFSGTVTALILIPDVRVGDTLHVAYTESGRNPVLGRTYADAASWDQPEPVELRHVTLTYPAKRQIAWRMAGDVQGAEVQVSQSESHGLRTVRFVGRDMPANESEPYVPPGYLPFRYLQFSEWKDWAGVAQWAAELFPPVQPKAPVLIQLLQNLRKLRNDEERVTAALQWVQSEVRYFSVALGESSHRPHSPDEVVDKRFGDCKDKTYLLLTILRELGIEAQPVLLSLSARDGIHKLMPAPDVFDHVILRVSLADGVYFLDGTRQRQMGALTRMGLGLDGADGLLVDRRTRALLTIANPQSRANSLNELDETIDVAELKSRAKLTVQQTWRGGAAESVRAFVAQATEEQQRKFALMGYERRYPGIALSAAPVFEDDKTLNRLTLRAQYEVPKMLMEANGEWGLRYFPSNIQNVFNVPDNIRRKSPVALFLQPYDARYHLTVNWPDSVRVVRDPSVQKIKSVAFDADVATMFRGSKAQQVIDFHTRRGELQPDELPAFLEDLRKMEKTIDGLVYVERDAIVRPGETDTRAVSHASLQDTIQGKLGQRLAKLNKTIDSGQLGDEDLASALCDRAEVLADLGRATEGIVDAEKAVAKAPESPRPWACRANLRFSMGQFAQAVVDHGKALALGQDAFETYYHRGVARYYLGKLPEAATDFGKAVAAATNESAKQYAMLWWTWTAKRVNKGMPNAIESAEPPAGGVWPWPAQALLLGRQTEDQVMAFVDNKTGDDRQLALAEAWFYIGQNQLLHGQKDLAKVSFEKARAQGITVYLEHVAAGFELQRMGAGR